MVLVLRGKPKNLASFIVSGSFDKFKDILATHSPILSFRNPSSFLQLSNGIFTPKTISARSHSTASSNRQTMVKHPRSMSEKITNLDDALQLFDEMTQRQPLPSVVKFNQSLQAVAKMKHYSCSIELFKQMNVVRVPVDAYTINIVIKCCCQMHHTSEGFAVLGYGFKRDISPDVCTFSALLNGLILEDSVLKAERLFKKLIKEELCEPDTIMYTTMIKGLCKFGNNDTAIALLKLMDRSGCKRNVVTYNTIIDSLCKDQMVDDAFNLFKEMVFHKGILPDVITYNSLIHGLCNLCRWDEVSKLLKEMEDDRISPSVNTFNILVDALCKEGKVEDANCVINIMIQRGKDS
uniref:Pentacotripeptide-repeat region of PRORP domain-containing protein n=1 Tax=Lactuca sativa TaxID=4236 RepID=A0A9R1W1Y6_LACSA|nr:hypothetical protein LSAT_V11C300146570 [Lactuca sativa]